MAEISVKRSLLVELLNCSDENTWHITQRCQLIDDIPSSTTLTGLRDQTYLKNNFNFNEMSDLFHGSCIRVQLNCFKINTKTIFAHKVDILTNLIAVTE